MGNKKKNADKAGKGSSKDSLKSSSKVSSKKKGLKGPKKAKEQSKIDLLREATYQESLALLRQYKKAVIVRPTSFGKTGILKRVIQDYILGLEGTEVSDIAMQRILVKAKKNSGQELTEEDKEVLRQPVVLFLYPQETVRQALCKFWYGEDGHDSIDGVKFMTYTKLARMDECADLEEFFGRPVLVLCDEMHRVGGKKTFAHFEQLMEYLPDSHFLSATATPERPDMKNVVGLFGDHVVSEYTLHHAFQDNVIKRPFYCFCSYTEADSEEAAEAAVREIELMDKKDQPAAREILAARLIEISRLHNMGNVIRDTCSECCKSDGYKKFLVFFSNYAHLHDKSEEVKGWFAGAFPDKEIRILEVTSETQETRDNVNALTSMEEDDNVVDLIYAVDMMNMGYHPGNLTGIVMYRGTASGIVYAQQLGRVLSSAEESDSPIVFDVVDNLHRTSVYDVLQQKSQKTIRRKERWTELSEKKLDTPEELTKEEKKELSGLEHSFGAAYAKTADGQLEVYKPQWWTTANELMPEDLVATGHEATYRDLIAKTVAEPISMRCRQAWNRWVEKGGRPEPMVREAILAQKAPDAVPLTPFAYLKSVSVEAILQEMGVA